MDNLSTSSMVIVRINIINIITIIATYIRKKPSKFHCSTFVTIKGSIYCDLLDSIVRSRFPIKIHKSIKEHGVNLLSLQEDISHTPPSSRAVSQAPLEGRIRMW